MTDRDLRLRAASAAPGLKPVQAPHQHAMRAVKGVIEEMLVGSVEHVVCKGHGYIQEVIEGVAGGCVAHTLVPKSLVAAALSYETGPGLVLVCRGCKALHRKQAV